MKKAITSILIAGAVVLGLFSPSMRSLIFRWRYISYAQKTIEEAVDAVEALGSVKVSDVTEYEYTDPETGNSVNRKEPVLYMNCTPGAQICCNAGYKSYPVNITFTASYVNGYVYPDGSQAEATPAYKYEGTNGPWYSEYPYQYSHRHKGREYTEAPLYNNPENVQLKYTAEFNSGYLYPDGRQVEVFSNN